MYEDHPKRIVLLHCRGALVGMHQIMGTSDEVPGLLEPYHEGLDFGDHIGDASLVQVKERFVLYRECMLSPGEGGDGDGEEGTDEFHPQQV
jgi:hypothetical protein